MSPDDRLPPSPVRPRRRPRVRLEELEDRTNPVTFAGAVQYGGGGSVDDGVDALTVDAAGNTYAAGHFQGTVDFDPGAGVTELVSYGARDAFVAKYSPAGDLVWAKVIGGSGTESAVGVAVDNQGNVIFVGETNSPGDTDYDPGPDTKYLGTGLYIEKLDAAGQFVWTRIVNNTGAHATGVAVDAAGNVAVSGWFTGSVYFTLPGAALTSAGGEDAFVAMYSPAKTPLWAARWGGTENDRAQAVTVDAAGNVLTTGYFNGTADLDPGAGTLSRTAVGLLGDAFVNKFGPGGTFAWAAQLSAGTYAAGYGVAADAAGNVYSTGSAYGSGDFDPGAGTATVSTFGYENPYLSKLDSAGKYVWAKTFAGVGFQHAGGAAVAVDPAGGVYVAGYHSETADFDPGAGTAPVASAGQKDGFVSKWDPAGTFKWAAAVGGTGFDEATAVAVARDGTLAVGGYFSDTADLDPTAGSNPVTSGGGEDGFLARLTQPHVTGTAWHDEPTHDGIRNNEPPLAGIVVELVTGAGDSLGTQVTGADGAYLFVDPPAAAGYRVHFRHAPGTTFVPEDQGANDAVDSDADDLDGRTAEFTFAGGDAVVLDVGIDGAPAAFGFAATAGGTGASAATGAARDAAGNLYVAGTVTGTVAFDPDFPAGPYTLTSAGGKDAFVAKYTPAGALMWARRVGGAADDEAAGVAVSTDGRVTVAGTFSGTGDFDPGVGTTNLTTAGAAATFVLTLDAAGNYGWAKALAGQGTAVARGVAIDAAGRVVTVGEFTGAIDIDPGPGNATQTTQTTRAFFSRLDAAGNYSGFRRLGLTGPGTFFHVDGVAADPAGGFVLTGTYRGSGDVTDNFEQLFLTGVHDTNSYVMKFTPTLGVAWVGSLGGSTEPLGGRPAVAVDAAGNIYAAGQFNHAADFDPGVGVYNVDVGHTTAAYAAKWTADGQFVWARALGDGRDNASLVLSNSIAVDAAGRTYLAGETYSSTDFDPGPNVARLTPQGQAGGEAFLASLDTDGGFRWVRPLGTPTAAGPAGVSSAAAGVVADGRGSAVAVGRFTGAADFDPSGRVYPAESAGPAALFVAGLNQATASGYVWHDANGDGLRQQSEHVAGISVALTEDGGPPEIRLTDATGQYSFTRAPNLSAAFHIRVAAPVGLAVGANDWPAAFSLAPGQNVFSMGTQLTGTLPAFGFAGLADAADGTVTVAATATDAAGNVYTTGHFTRTVDFDPTGAAYPLAAGPDPTGFVAKYTPGGALVWARSLGDAGTTAQSEGHGLAVDAGGDVVVGGRFGGQVDFNPDPAATNLLVSNDDDSFLLKLDAAGGYIWAEKFGGQSGDQVNGVAVDPAGNIYAAGAYLGAMNADPNGSVTLPGSANVYNAYVSKLTPAGALVWARGVGGLFDAAEFTGVAVDPAGNVYTGGLFTGSADFDPSPSATATLTSAGSEDGVVVKWTPAGDFAWAGRAGGPAADEVAAVAVDAGGDVALVGRFAGTADFDPAAGTAYPLTAAAGDGFAAKWTAAGQFAYARRVGGAGSDTAAAVAADPLGNVFVTGDFADSMTVPLPTGPVTLTAAGAGPYLLKLDSAGRPVTAKQIAGTGTGSGRGVAAGPNGTVALAGRLSSPGDFDPYAGGGFPLANTAGDDAYAARWVIPDVSGAVWTDQDKDGRRGGPEPGFAGARVELYGTVNGVEALLAAVATEADGVYHFPAPPRGVPLRVRIRPPVGAAGENPAYAELTVPGDGTVNADGWSAPFDLTSSPTHAVTAGLIPVSAPTPGWAVGGSGADGANGVARDAAGNTFVVGSFRGPAVDLDPRQTDLVLASAAGGGAYVAKYDAAGVPVWATLLGGTAGDAASAVALDAAGNVLVVGTFTGTGAFGGVTLTSAGGTDAFVAKLNPTGAVQWANRYGGAGADAGAAVAADPSNNVHAAGTFSGGATIGGTAFANAAGADAFLVKLTPLGANAAAPRQLGGAGDVTVGGLAASATTVFVAGSFAGTVDLNPSPTLVDEFTSVGGSADAFVVKLAAVGSVWARQFGDGGADAARGLALTAAGDVLFTGDFIGSVDMDAGTGIATLTSAGATDAFVAKYDGLGNYVWAKAFGAAGADAGAGVATDARGYVYVAGSFAGQVSFGGPAPLASVGATDAFVAKLTADGAYAYADRVGGDGADAPAAITVSGQGGVAVVGSFAGTADVAFGRTDFLLGAGAQTDGFVARLDEFAVAGRVWVDLNGDGVRGPNEPAVQDAVAELYDTADGVPGNGDDQFIGRQTTAGGAYQFLDPADSAGYYVRVTPPAGRASPNSLPVYFATAPRQGDDRAADSDIDETGRTGVVSRTYGEAGSLGAGFQEAPLTAGGWGIGGLGAETANGVATDAAGNVYVVGSFSGAVDFDPRPTVSSLASAGGADGFVAKYDAAGRLLWARRLGGAAQDAAVAVTVTPAGRVAVVGTFEGTADFGPGSPTLTAHGSGTAAPGRAVFVLTLTADGDFVWAKALGGAKAETVTGVAADAAGNVFTTGTFTGAADFNPDPKKAATLTSTAKKAPAAGPSIDIYVSKLDKDGKYVWARKVGSAADDAAAGVAADAQGNVYFDGKTFDEADVDPGAGARIIGGAFVVKYDAAGKYVWAVEEYAYNLTAITVAGDSVYAAGAQLWKLSLAGETDLAVELGLTYRAVAVYDPAPGLDGAGIRTVHLAGTFSGTFDADPSEFASSPLTAAGASAAVVTRLDAGGNFLSARQLDGATAGAGVAVGPDGTSVVAGAFQAAADFDVGPAAQVVVSAGGGDAFVWKVPVGGITGRVWHDADGDGLRGPTEPVVGGAVVERRTAGGVIDRQVTAADGTYHFAAPFGGGEYFVTVRPPALPGVGFTAGHAGGNAFLDSDVDAAGQSAPFVADAAVPTVIDAGIAGDFPLFGAAWAAGGPGTSAALANATDAAGNVYVTGEFQGAVDFDPGPGELDPSGAATGKKFFVAKYTPAGIIQWAAAFEGSVDVGGHGIGVDAAGSVYVAGRFSGSLVVIPSSRGGPGLSLVSAGYDAFVVKLDGAGGVQWAKALGGAGNDYAYGVAVGGGRVVVAGSFQGEADFDPGPAAAPLTSFGAQDAFVAALTADGDYVWARRVGGAGGDDVARGVTLGAAGAVFVAGSFSGTADFDPGTVVRDLTSRGLRDAFVWKLDAAGAAAWAAPAGGPQDDDAAAVAVTAAGDVYAAGAFADAADFDPGPGLLEVQSAGAADAFVWRLTAAGAAVWAKPLGGVAADGAAGVAADATGVYVAGSFRQTADFDPGPGQILLASAGGADAFVAKLDPAGGRQWAHRAGGASNDAGQGVAVDAAGRVTAAGSLYGAGAFDPGDGDLPLTGGPAANAVVARVDQTLAGGAYALDAFEPNNAAAFATDLGVVNVEQVVAGLGLSSGADRDWFHFNLLTAGRAGDRVRVDVTPGHGDAALALFRDGQVAAVGAVPVVDGATAAGEISLAGLAAGSYRVRVTGAANPGYTLTVDAPPGFAPDAREPNDALSHAADLGYLTAPAAVPRLSANTPEDVDWFAFETAAAGTLAAEVRIDFRTGQGDLDLDLFAGDGTPLRSSAGAGDVEAVSLEGLPAGQYFARVTGHAGAINPAYTLTVRPPRPLEPDGLEPNDSLAAATALGELRGESAWDNLSVHAAADADWFQFVTAAQGEAGHAVAIDFAHADGDLDLRLFDAAGAPVAASTGAGDTELVSLQGVPAGTYYAKVSGFAGATQPAYRLRVAAPVGAVADDRLEGAARNQTRQTASVVQTPGSAKLEGAQSLVDLTLNVVGGKADEDWFKFTTAGKGTAQHSVTLTSPAANGKLGLELYNAAGKKLAAGAGDSGRLAVSLKGRAAGTYYARAFIPKGGSTGSNYALTFDAPTSAAAAAPDAWTVMVYMTADSLADRAFNDINEMEAAAAKLPGSVNLAVLWDQSANLKTFPTGNGAQKAWGTTGRALIAPDTNPAAVATKFELLPEKDTGAAATVKDFVAWAKQAAPAAHYALVFWDHGAGLRGFNFDTQDGQPADHLTPAKVVTALAGQPKLDLIAFDACFMGVAETAFTLRGAAAVVVGSQDAEPGDGFEYDTAFAALATDPGAVTAEALGTGLVRAFAERYGTTGAGDTLAAVSTAALDAVAAALKAVAAAASLPGPAAAADRVRMVAAAGSALLPNPAAPAQRDLGGFLAALAADGELSSGLRGAAAAAVAALDSAVVSRTADLRGHSGLSVYLPVSDVSRLTIDPAAISDYATEYAGFAAATDWLTLLTKMQDAAEHRPNNQDADEAPTPNNVLSTATDLRQLGATGLVKSGLSLDSIDDTDWYKFQVTAGDGATLAVDVRGPAALAAELRDGANQTLATAAGGGRLVVEGLPAGPQTFYLYFHSAAVVNSYGFTVNPPVAAADQSGDNSAPDKTYALPPDATGAYAGFSVAAASQDWLRFDTTAQTSADLRRVTLTVAGGAAVRAQLRTAAGFVVSSAAGTGAIVLPYTLTGGAESYTLVIVNPTAAAVSYSLRLEAAAADGAHPLDRFNRTGALDLPDWAVTGGIAADGAKAVVTSAAARALWNGFTAADGGVQAAFALPPAGKPTASVLARATETGADKKLTAYEARLELYKGALTAKLYRVVNGGASLLTFAAAPKVSAGVLRFEAQGQYLRILVDGNQCLEFTDTVVLGAGRAGIAGTKDAAIDDFQAAAVVAPLPVSYAAVAGGLGPAWRAVTGTFAAQDGKFVSGNSAASAAYLPARLADVAVSAAYSLTAANQYVGVFARDTGAASRSYYEAQVSRAASGTITVKLVRYVNGAASVRGTATLSATAGTLRLAALGNELRVLIDGVEKIKVRDAGVPLAGRAGLSAAGAMSAGGFAIVALAPRAADGFDRAPATVLGGGWAEKAGDLALAGGRLTGVADGYAVVGPLLADAAVSALVDLSAAGQHTVGLIARYTTGGDYYEGRVTRNPAGTLTAVIYRVGPGTEKALKTLTMAKATAGVLRFDVEGSTLKLTLLGESMTVTDTTLTGPGQAGVRLGAGDTADDFVVR